MCSVVVDWEDGPGWTGVPPWKKKKEIIHVDCFEK